MTRVTFQAAAIPFLTFLIGVLAGIASFAGRMSAMEVRVSSLESLSTDVRVIRLDVQKVMDKFNLGPVSQ